MKCQKPNRKLELPPPRRRIKSHQASKQGHRSRGNFDQSIADDYFTDAIRSNTNARETSRACIISYIAFNCVRQSLRKLEV
jgi:hypothetical protein